MNRACAMVIVGVLAVAAAVNGQQQKKQVSPGPDTLKGKEPPSILREQKDHLPDKGPLPPLKKGTKPSDKKPADKLDPEIYRGLLRERDTTKVNNE